MPQYIHSKPYVWDNILPSSSKKVNMMYVDMFVQ